MTEYRGRLIEPDASMVVTMLNGVTHQLQLYAQITVYQKIGQLTKENSTFLFRRLPRLTSLGSVLYFDIMM